MIIGITGFNASGKTEIANFLEKKGFNYISANKILSQIAKKQKVSNDRVNLRKIANDLRVELGPNALILKAKELFDFSKDIVIESIRNPGEVLELQKEKDFYLFGVSAKIKLRYERAKLRNRDKDVSSFDEFKNSEEKELYSIDKTSQQLVKTYDLKDFEIKNDGSMLELEEKVLELIKIIKTIDTSKKRFENSYFTIHKFGKKIIKKSFKHKYYLDVAKAIAKRSTCLSARYGAVIANDEIISTGYVGAPRGVNSSLEQGFCLRRKLNIPSGQQYEICRSVHAEQNAIINAARTGISIVGATLYFWGERYSENGETNMIDGLPCFICKKMILNSGLKYFISNTKDGKIMIYDIDDWREAWSKGDMLSDNLSYK